MIKYNEGEESELKDTLYIVMPAYNEEANIVEVVKSWYEILKGKPSDSRLVVADSESEDRTHELLLGLAREMPQLEIISDTGKEHGSKVIALFKLAILRGGVEWIFQTDTDGQTNPKEFDSFWELREKYDAVIGMRMKREDGGLRILVEKVVCFLLKIIFGVKIPDANAPFRLMKVDLVKKYLYKMPEDYNLPNIMLTTYFEYFKEKIAFVSISFKERNGGKNSINIIKIFKIGLKAIGQFIKFKKEMDR